MLKNLILGIIVGVIIGILCPFNISLISGKLLLIIVLAGIDVLFSSTNAKLLQQFDGLLFTNEFILNSILSVVLVYLGNVMGQNIFSIIALVLIFKIFYNLNRLLHTIVTNIKNKNSTV